MTRIPYPDVATLTETVRRMLAGTPINIVGMAAHASPALFEASGRLGYAISTPENLDPRLRETAILRVAHLSDSRYELYQHLSIARAVGLTQAEIDAIGTQAYDRLDPVLAAVARFTDDLVLHVSPGDDTLGGLRARVPDRVLVNLVMCIGHYMTVARLIAVTGVDPDEEPLTHLPVSAEDQAR